jgi:hypothetical protein
MATADFEVWPFVTAADRPSVGPDAEIVAFLELSAAKGYEAFRFGLNDFGAKTSEREGCMLERGRKRWELRLADGNGRRLLAHVADFSAAASAVHEWLEGVCVNEVLGHLQNQLVTPPGAQASYTVCESNCES